MLSVIRGGFSIELADPLPGGVIRLAPPRMPPRMSRGIAAEVHSLCIRGVMERAVDHPRLCLPPTPPPPSSFLFPALGIFLVDSKPEENQPAYQPVTLQDGNTEVHPPPVQTRGLDCVHRPKGRLPSRPNRSRIKGHSRLCSSLKYVPLQGATVRPKARTTPVHKARSVRGSLPQAAGPASVLLPGRLAPGGRVPGTTVPPAALPTTDSAGPGVYSKLGEVGAYAFTAPDLPRSRHRSTPPTISQALHPRLSALHLTKWPLSGRPAHRRAFSKCFPKKCEISKCHSFLISYPIFIIFAPICREIFTLSFEIMVILDWTSPLKSI